MGIQPRPILMGAPSLDITLARRKYHYRLFWLSQGNPPQIALWSGVFARHLCSFTAVDYLSEMSLGEPTNAAFAYGAEQLRYPTNYMDGSNTDILEGSMKEK